MEGLLSTSREVRSVTAAEISRNFGAWQDRASNSPIVVTHHGRPRVALVSIEDLNELERMRSPAPDESSDSFGLSVLAEQISGGFATFDRELRFGLLNTEAITHFGKPVGALIGNIADEALPELRSAPIMAALRRVADGAEAMIIDTPSSLYQDRLMRCRVFAYPGGVATIFKNIAFEAQAEHATSERAAIFEASVVHCGIALITLSLKATIEREGLNLARLIALPPERIRGARLTDLVRTQDRRLVASGIESVIIEKKGLRLETAMLTNTGVELPVVLAMVPVLRGFDATSVIVLLSTIEPQRS